MQRFTSTYFQHVKDVGQEFSLKPTIIRGEELAERGFGGIYGVGKVSWKILYLHEKNNVCIRKNYFDP